MSYTPTNWQTGDVITAEKLNKLEGGVASGGEEFVVTFTEIQGAGGEYSADKTATEAKAAYDAGKKVVGVITGQSGIKGECYKIEEIVYEEKVGIATYFQWVGPWHSGSTFSGFKFVEFLLNDYDGQSGVVTNTVSVS